MNTYAGTDTRDSSSGKLIRRMRKYTVNGQVYCITKDFSTNDFQLAQMIGLHNFCICLVNNKEKWGAGLTWKQAEAKAEKAIVKWISTIDKVYELARNADIQVQLVSEAKR